MQKFLSAAMAVLALGQLSASPASAKFSCTGPAASCVSASHSGGKSIASTKYLKAGQRTSNVKARSAKSKSYASRKGGSGKRFVATSRKSKSAARYSGGSSRGMASYYWQPQAVASGGRFNPNALTAAHKTLPFGTRVRVTNLNNGRSVTVTINDRGPYIKGRVIDLSRRAAQVVGMTGSGVAPVSYTIVGRG